MAFNEYRIIIYLEKKYINVKLKMNGRVLFSQRQMTWICDDNQPTDASEELCLRTNDDKLKDKWICVVCR